MRSLAVGFAGMTHLGVVSSAAMAAQGFRTTGYDADHGLIGRLRSGELPIHEPGLAEIVRSHAALQRFTAEAGELRECDVVYVSADVPTDSSGRSDLAPIRALIDKIATALRSDALLVISSQVPPGFTRGIGAIPHSRLYYQVETLVFGRAMERALKPERFIIGCAEPAEALDRRLVAVLSAFGCPLLPMRYESAELAKIAVNCCLAASLGAANTLAELCEQIGADWSEIIPALQLDRRIGEHAYLAPGLGIAGGNLERDLATVIDLGVSHHSNTDVLRALLTNSRHRSRWAAQTLRRVLIDRMPNAKVAVWGLSYKENTHSVRNSPSLATLCELAGTTFTLHDPVVPASALSFTHAVAAGDPKEILTGADALMILTPWPQYRAVPPAEIVQAMRGRIVIDPYQVLDRTHAIEAGLEYHAMGVAAESAGKAR